MIRGTGALKLYLFGLYCASLVPCLFNHVANDFAVLVLRTEHDDLRIRLNTHIVSWWPIEEVIGADGFLVAGSIGRGEFTPQHKSPMGTLTEVSFQSLE